MIISVINHTNGKISDQEAQRVIRAINRQIAQDFDPYWSMSATLRLEGRSSEQPNIASADMRGDAVIYLWDQVNVVDALGFHDRNFRGIPFGFVFTALSAAVGENWTVTLSHEALEMIADPEVNLLVMGPHPDPNSNAVVFHWYEMCDAVQDETYEIDGEEVSNFVLPLYFTGGEELGGRNDFLGTKHNGTTLRSFGINPGGYVGFFDPAIPDHDTFSRSGVAEMDKKAEERMNLKDEAELARRSRRYQHRPKERSSVSTVIRTGLKSS